MPSNFLVLWKNFQDSEPGPVYGAFRMQTGCGQSAGAGPAKPIALMRVAGLEPFVAFSGREQAPLELLLARAKIPPAVFERPESLIPVTQVMRFMDEAARGRGLDTLGARAGLATPVDALGTFGRLIARADTLEQAIATLIRAAPAFDSGSRYWLTRQGDRTWLCHQFRDGLAAPSRQADHYWLMVVLNVVRLAAGPSWRPDEIRLESPKTPGLRDLESLLGARVAFEKDESAVGFPTSLLGRPLARPRVGRPMLSSNDVDRWAATAPADGFVESILQVVVTLALSGGSRVDAVARAIGMSVRTLQRRLGTAGTSYQRVLERARFRTAAQLLSTSGATVLDVALDVGYSDHAHFTRAFVRWAGVSPREFRRRGHDDRSVSRRA